MEYSRRNICSALATLGTIGVLSSPIRSASASQNCWPGPYGNVCRSEVNFTTFAAQAYDDQDQSQWCWAACVSMIFGYYGYTVSQERIVEEVYGARVNLPAMTGSTISQMVHRDWIDDDGQEFSSEITGLYDAMAGRAMINNNMIINELASERPMIIGARTHAMVLTAIEYIQTYTGPNVTAAGVFDPWPGIGAPGLAPDELVPVHLNGSILYMVSMRVT